MGSIGFLFGFVRLDRSGFKTSSVSNFEAVANHTEADIISNRILNLLCHAHCQNRFNLLKTFSFNLFVPNYEEVPLVS